MAVAEPPAELPPAAPPTETLTIYVRRWWSGVKAGDLGSLPIIVGLVIIAFVFQTQNSQFLTAGNFVNLIVQMAGYMTIAMGIVFVLLLGEIDLSVGYVSGVSGVLVAILLTPDGNELPTAVVIVLALLSGLAIGTFHGLLITKIGIPSFVVTLAGLLGWNGAVLLLIGNRGTVIVQNDFVIGFANDFMSETVSWILVLVCVAIYGALLLTRARSRTKVGLAAEPMVLIGLRIAALAIALAIVTYVANQDRGIPYVGILLGALLLFWGFVLGRTKFGRYVYAVGGNQEAARRAGVNVDRIKICVFGICSMMAALGGIILASRLRSVDTNAGGGDILLSSIAAAVIGGTSLFGGRGHIKAALLGALVITSINNGLGLLGLSSGTKFVVTGAVLLLAVTVDSFSRRRQASTGRA
jgi:D-xylose transport system permease protein